MIRELTNELTMEIGAMTEEKFPAQPEDRATSSSQAESAKEASIPGEESSKRDPILEELLKSKGDADEVAPPRAKGKKTKERTGTSLDRKKSRAPIIAAVVAGALILGGGATAGIMWLAPDQAQIDPDGDSDKLKDANGVTKEIDPEEAPWNSGEEDAAYPIDLEDWQKIESNKAGSSPEELAAVNNALYGSDIFASAGILPSEAAGFTSDDSQAELEDGSLNPLYSYWTQEVFVGEAGAIIERFLNPIYGGWTTYQTSSPSSIAATELFPNVFTDSFIEAETRAPIYADWEGNGYGRSDLQANNGIWFGSVESSETTFTWDGDMEQYSATFVGNVKFTAYTKDGGTATQTGVLTVDFVANPDGVRGSGGKVLVDSANLSIGG